MCLGARFGGSHFLPAAPVRTQTLWGGCIWLCAEEEREWPVKCPAGLRHENFLQSR